MAIVVGLLCRQWLVGILQMFDWSRGILCCGSETSRMQRLSMTCLMPLEMGKLPDSELIIFTSPDPQGFMKKLMEDGAEF